MRARIITYRKRNSNIVAFLGMDVLPLLFLIFLFYPQLVIGQSKYGCPILRCGHDSPGIRFPFYLKGKHPPQCGSPGFELSCMGNMTVPQLPFSGAGLFSVMTIDYEYQNLRISDPDDCLVRRLLNFSLSGSPFTSEYVPTDNLGNDYMYFADSNTRFTLVNCSSSIQVHPRTFSRYIPIPCLSGPGHKILAVSPHSDATEFPCPKIKTIPLPTYWTLSFQDSIIYELRNDLELRWDIPRCQGCETQGGKCRYKNNTSLELACFDIPEASKKGACASSQTLITGVSIAIFLLILGAVAAMIIFFRIKRRNKKDDKENQAKVEKFLEDYKSQVPTRYSYADIAKMTNGFKKKLGRGGFGSVFKGKLPNGFPVAVKVLNDSKGNADNFVNEVGTIGRIHHVNVVRLVGFCAEERKRALIYEFMPNKSLEKFSSSSHSENPSLGWAMLQNIATGIAKGMEYLHEGCHLRILHFDIKPHNILLDHNFNPKISDFGLAKLCSKDQSLMSMTAARGTIGYIAPEVFGRNLGNVSHKSDVYSFGMLVLEMVGGRKSPDVASSCDGVYFPEWLYNRLIQGQELGFKVDSEEDADTAKKLMIVSLWCIQWYAVNRPSMKAVVRMLEGGSESLVMPPNPFASTAHTVSDEALPDNHIM